MGATCNAYITAALLMAAAVAAGCSDRVEPASEERQPARPVAQRPAPAVPAPVATAGAADEESAPAPVHAGPVTFAEGEAAYHARNYVEARQIFARYVEQRPENAWGHFMLGLSAWKAGDVARAEEAFEEALSIDPKHLKSLINLSRVRLDTNRPERALEALVRARDLEASSGEVHRLLGRAYHQQGEIAAAIEAYGRAIDLDPQDSWAMNNLGLILLEQGWSWDALPLLARAVELQKDVAMFQNNLGMALEHTGHFAAAADAYAAAVAADEGYDKAQRNLARVSQVRGGPEVPFDLETTAQRYIEVVMTWHDEGRVSPE